MNCNECGEVAAGALCELCVEDGVCSVKCPDCGAPPMRSCAGDDPCTARVTAIVRFLAAASGGDAARETGFA
jgi:hypothetical protein